MQPSAALYAVAIPVAIYLGSLWFVRDRLACRGAARYTLIGSGLVTLLVPASGLGLGGIAATTALGVILRNTLISTASKALPPSH
jgi:hypothetical protein